MTEPRSAPLLVEDVGRVRRLVLNRPTRKNALDGELLSALGDALAELANPVELRVVVLGGAGGAFCSGADLSLLRGASAEESEPRLEQFHRLIRGIEACPLPVVAEVDGPAVGFGADLALACDLRVLSERAYLEQSFVRLGLMPDGGGTYTLARHLGPGRAFEALALAERFDAGRCAELGMANHVVAADRLRETTMNLAERLAAAAPLALRHIKQSLRGAEADALHAALAREKAGQLELLRSADFAEGLAAFAEKRAPVFRGN